MEFDLHAIYFFTMGETQGILKLLITLSAVLMSPALLAHGVAEGDKGYIQEIYGVHIIPLFTSGQSTWLQVMTICCSSSGLSFSYIA